MQDIGEAMDRLPDDQRAAIVLVAVEGFSYDEAAAAMDVPVGTIRSRLSRGREHLRELYAERDQDPKLRRVK
jgi:RNA polymerase sigma-70 factor (ECF subfamily)